MSIYNNLFRTVFSILLCLPTSKLFAQNLLNCTVVSECYVENGEYSCYDEMPGVELNIFIGSEGEDRVVFSQSFTRTYSKVTGSSTYLNPPTDETGPFLEVLYVPPENNEATIVFMASDGTYYGKTAATCTEAN